MRVDLAAQVFTMRDVCICVLTHSQLQVLSECVHKAYIVGSFELVFSIIIKYEPKIVVHVLNLTR